MCHQTGPKRAVRQGRRCYYVGRRYQGCLIIYQFPHITTQTPTARTGCGHRGRTRRDDIRQDAELCQLLLFVGVYGRVNGKGQFAPKTKVNYGLSSGSLVQVQTNREKYMTGSLMSRTEEKRGRLWIQSESSPRRSRREVSGLVLWAHCSTNCPQTHRNAEPNTPLFPSQPFPSRDITVLIPPFPPIPLIRWHDRRHSAPNADDPARMKTSRQDSAGGWPGFPCICASLRVSPA